MASGAAAPGQRGAPGSRDAEVQLLLKALRASGSPEAAQRFGGILLKWAQEGRPYRGRVFSAASVEAAVAQLAPAGPGAASGAAPEEAAGAARRPAAEEARGRAAKPAESGRAGEAAPAAAPPDAAPASEAAAPRAGPRPRVARIRAGQWPPACTAEAAAEVVHSVGTLDSQHAAAAPASEGAGLRLLGALHALAREGAAPAAGGGDVRVVLDGEEDGSPAVYAHRNILASISDTLTCKFDGRFGDLGTRVGDRVLLSAGGFDRRTVLAAIRFAYTGACEVEEADVGPLFSLADFWQMPRLIEAVLDFVGTLPSVDCIRALGCWDFSQVEHLEHLGSRNLVAALLDRAGEGMRRAAKIMPAEEGWAFTRQLSEAVSALPPQRLGDLLEPPQPLGQGAAAGLADPASVLLERALATACAKDLPLLASLRCLLTRGSLQRLLESLCRPPNGVLNEEGTICTWFDWVCDPSWGFAKLWELHGLLRSCVAAAAPGAAGAPGAPEAGAAPQERQESKEHVFWSVDRAFVQACVSAFAKDPEAPIILDSLLFSPGAGGEALSAAGRFVLEEAVQLLGRLLGRNPRLLPPGLPARSALKVLAAATRDLPAAAVRVTGPSELSGVYALRPGATCSADGPACFERACPAGQAAAGGHGPPAAGAAAAPLQPLVLRRVPRGLAAAGQLRVGWTGIQMSAFKFARLEWKLQLAGDDAEADAPLAVALQDVCAPDQPIGPWWLRAGDRHHFRPDAQRTLFAERCAAAEAEVLPFAKAVWAWRERGGDLPELTGLAAGDGADGRVSPLVVQICAAAGRCPEAARPRGGAEEGPGAAEGAAQAPAAEELGADAARAVPREAAEPAAAARAGATAPGAVASPCRARAAAEPAEGSGRCAKAPRLAGPRAEGEAPEDALLAARRSLEDADKAARAAALRRDAAWKAWQAADEEAARCRGLREEAQAALAGLELGGAGSAPPR